MMHEEVRTWGMRWVLWVSKEGANASARPDRMFELLPSQHIPAGLGLDKKAN